MEAQKFTSGDEIQVGGLCTSTAQTVAASTASTAFTADKIVEVQDVDGDGAWFVIGSGAVADSGAFIPPYGSTRPFILAAGEVIEATAKINIRTCDIEGA